MIGGQWERVQALFDEAAKRSKDEQLAFLKDACGGDAALLAEVSSLLAYDEDAPRDFMEPGKARQPEPEAHFTESPDRLIGASIGQYAIRGVIGHGGMGAVYLAEQTNPRRDVALKIMRGGIALAPVMRRFEHEGQVLARLHHPHIAQIYEAGFHTVKAAAGEEHVPYFAMEFVHDAETIVAYAERNKLTVKQRLVLFLQVCNAVEHGHQKGIIHRDLKPDNILVDYNGCVKVIDFGVAKSTDSDMATTTMLTDVGTLVGTLQYMSPEQFAADPHNLDTRSDVYTLGVVLYELLCANLPYDLSGSAIHTIARVICEEPPVPLSEVNRRLRGDLETVVLKALEKDRSKRYQSVAEFAKDAQRYLDHEPIAARAPTAWNRAHRWIARHPLIGTACAASLIAACIVTTAAISAWWYTKRPHSIEVDPSMEEARLLSVAGGPVYTWPSTGSSLIKEAMIIDVPVESGGGRIAVIGRSPGVVNELDGTLCAYSLESWDYSRDSWCNSMDDQSIPIELKNVGRTAKQFGIQRLFVHDVFAELPGDEIIAVFAAQSERCVRIIDHTGVVRFQVWYDGVIHSTYWMSGEKLLVLAGDSGTARLSEYGFPKALAHYPSVVLAIKPRLGLISAEFIGQQPGTSEIAPTWFHYLVYPFASVKIDNLTLTAGTVLNPDQTVRIGIFVSPARWPDASLSWLIDAQGNELDGSRSIHDPYLDDPSLPNPSTFYFSDALGTVIIERNE